MEKENKKCSLKDHIEIDAISYCQECKIYMCNKCEKVHSGLCQNHHIYKLDKNIGDIFTGFCKEEKHYDMLNYFCRTHNQLCCSACIVKIKRKENGQHKDCNVCVIEDIKQEKKDKLKENIIILENLSNTFEDSINKLKEIFGKLNNNKEEMKMNIQKVFTKIRNAINEREDEIMIEVDKLFENLFIKESLIKEGEKLPNKIKKSLEKGKSLKDELNVDNNLRLFLNDCINIEYNINEIKRINDNINKCNYNDSKIKFK